MKKLAYLIAPLTILVTMITSSREPPNAKADGPWALVEELHEKWASGDVEGVLSGLHDDFSSWRYDAHVPNDKEDARLILQRYGALYDVLSYDIAPLVVTEFENAAIVHFHYENTAMWKGGREFNDSWRMTVFLVKEGGRWQVAGEHGGSLLQEPL